LAAHRPIFILSDFGLADPFVGIMKAVLLGLGHEGAVVDLTHAVPAQDVRRAVLVIEDSLPSLPHSAVVLAVVDPGVGSGRHPIVVRDSVGRLFVGPDNGLLSPALREGGEARIIEPGGPIKPGASATFHGRDVFAPAAALLAVGGRQFSEIGAPLESPVILPHPEPVVREDGQVEFEILAYDVFGNAALCFLEGRATGLPPLDKGSFHLGGRPLGPLRRTYSDVEAGQPLVYVNSFGRLEAAINGGSFRAHFFPKSGAKLCFVPQKNDPPPEAS
jgi:S-adenosylmethionine hydrolase